MSEASNKPVNDFRLAMSETMDKIPWDDVSRLVSELRGIRDRDGRVFVIGLGGSAGNASHMVNDLRKLAGLEAYAPTDNVSEFTARVNDDGWGNALVGTLKASKLSSRDAVFVLSVGGGSIAHGVSTELVNAVKYSKTLGTRILGIVGRDGGYTGEVGDCVVIVPPVSASLVTPIAEAFQAVLWHFLVSHPDLAISSAHWESLENR